PAANVGQVQSVTGPCDHIGKNVTAATQFFGYAHRQRVTFTTIMPDSYQAHEALRLSHRQRPPQGGVCCIKNDSIGAYAEGECENGHNGETGRLAEHARGEP